MVQRYPVTRLEQALTAWEDSCVIGRCYAHIAQANGNDRREVLAGGPLVHWREFRQALRRSRGLNFDEARFTGSPRLLAGFGNCQYLPRAIARWTADSRRVYSLDENLQAVLYSTSLGHMNWGDIIWPFPSFFVSLAHPLQVDPNDTVATFDALLISSISTPHGSDWIEFRLFTPTLDHYRPLADFDKKRLARLTEKTEWSKLKATIEPQAIQLSGINNTTFYLKAPQANVPVRTAVAELWDRVGEGPQNAGVYPECDAALHIVLGLCIYLQGLTSNEGGGDWRPFPRSLQRDPRSLSEDSEVCSVACSYQLTDEERRIFGGKGSHAELCAHFRRAHWRKRPGFASDPTARKTIRVKFARVRHDRLRPGELAGGTKITTR